MRPPLCWRSHFRASGYPGILRRPTHGFLTFSAALPEPSADLRQAFGRLLAGLRQVYIRREAPRSKIRVLQDFCCVPGSPVAFGGCLRPPSAPGGPPSSAGGGATIALRQGPESHKSVGCKPFIFLLFFTPWFGATGRHAKNEGSARRLRCSPQPPVGELDHYKKCPHARDLKG